MTGTAFDLLSYYIKLLHDISSYHFNNCWQMFQFMLCQLNLQGNQILLIQDFARNFVIDFQDEPKTLHWFHDQVTVHPTICCFSCPKAGCYCRGAMDNNDTLCLCSRRGLLAYVYSGVFV